MKFVQPRPYADAEAAMRKLLEIAPAPSSPSRTATSHIESALCGGQSEGEHE
jgi:hypothetical protein